jgi:chromosome segregation ATPase
MNTKIDELFATLRGLVSDQSRDLAMVVDELRSVAQQRDKALTERDAARAGYSAMNKRIYGKGGECFELDKARAERDSANWSLSRAKESLRAAEADVEEIDTLCNDFRRANSRLSADLAAATQRADTAEAILRARA